MNKSFMGAFEGLKPDTIRRNSSKSLNWLFQKIKKSRFDQGLLTGKPQVGGMYVYTYDSKTKEKLPYWDATPVIVLLSFTQNGFYGINWHYLSPGDRTVLIKNLLMFDNGKSKQFLREPYKRLLALSNGVWRCAVKRYLWGQVRSKFIPIQKDEWQEAAALPLARFRKATATTVYRNARKFTK